MTQTATSKRGQGVIVDMLGLPDEGQPGPVRLYVDNVWHGEFSTGESARAKAAEVTDDVGLIWETRP